MKRRVLSLILSACMLLSMLPAEVLAVSDAACSHHPEHNAQCGYSAPVPAVPCGHSCEEACYTAETSCLHLAHDESCGGMEEETLCAHVCGAENGCVTRSESCQHTHDELCGYAQGSEGTPCTFQCQDCAGEAEVPEAAVDVTAAEPSEEAVILTSAETPSLTVSSSNIVYLNPGDLWHADQYDYAVWAWYNDQNGEWVTPGAADENGCIPFDVGDRPNVIFAAIRKGYAAHWDNKVHQTVDLRFDPAAPYFTLAEGQEKYNGSWSATLCEHVWSSEVTTAPTCLQTGVETHTCANCGSSYEQTLPTAEHTWNENGICTVCGESKAFVYFAWDFILDPEKYDCYVWAWDLVWVEGATDGHWVSPMASNVPGYSAFQLNPNDKRLLFAFVPKGEQPEWDKNIVVQSADSTVSSYFTFGNWQVTSDATGNGSYFSAQSHEYCDHDWETTKNVPAGCATVGEVIMKCRNCQQVSEYYTPATGHSYGDDWICTGCRDNLAVASVTLGSETTFYTDVLEAFTQANGGTAENPAAVKLLKNVTYAGMQSITIANGAHVTLDLNGKTLTFDNSTTCFYVSSGGNLTLTDSSEGKTGVVDMKKGKIYVLGAQLILDSGKLIAYGGQYGYDPVIEITAKSTLVQNGGWIESRGDDAAVEAWSNSSYTQNGGTVSTISFYFVILNASEYTLHDGSLILGANTYVGDVAIILNMQSNSTAVINGGVHTVNIIADIYDESDGSKLTINGGTFKAATRSTVECGIIKSPNAVVKYKGGIFENGLKKAGSAVQTLGDMLAPGYVYYDASGEVMTLTEGQTEIAEYVKVAPCAHSVTYTTADGHHTATCSDCGLVTEDNVVCTPVIQDADCTTEEKCACGYVIQEAKAEHDFSGAYLRDAEGHWHKCANCEVTDTKAEHSGVDDNNCTTAVLCSDCGYTMTEAKAHTGTDDKLISKGVLHHDVVWSCCGAVVTENVTCTASNADGSCSTAEKCACGNLLIAAKDNHKLTYTASGNVITETCGWQGCEHTATATLHAPENPVYDGTQKLATVTYSGGWAGYSFDAISYSGTANDGSSYAGILYPAVKAGTVTARITAQSEDYTVATASVEYTIEKATPDVGTVSVEGSEAIYPHTAITLARTDETVPGTLELNAGQTLTVGTKEYDWTFTPGDTNNYNGVTGKVSITVVEDALQKIEITTPPTKTEYTYGDTFDKTGMVVTATYASGATVDVTDQVTIESEMLTVATTSVDVCYEGFTDTQAVTVNPMVINNYNFALTTSHWEYTGEPVTVTFYVWGYRFEELPASEYTVTYTNNIAIGEATITLTDKPGGNYEVNASLTFNIVEAVLKEVSVSQNGTLTYTGEAQTPTVSANATTVDGATVNFTYCLEQNGTYVAELPTFTNAGTYTVYFKANAANHMEASGSFEVVIGKATNEWTTPPSLTGWTYGAYDYNVNAPAATAKFGDEIMFAYRAKGTVDWNVNPPTDAGIYEMRARVQASDNWELLETIVEFEIKKATPSADCFTLIPPANVCDGKPKEVTVTAKDGVAGMGGILKIHYFKDGTALDGAPTTVGTYTVQIDVAEGVNYFAAENLMVGTFTFAIDDATEHKDAKYQSNKDGTHDLVCTICQTVIEDNAACSYQQYVQNSNADGVLVSAATCTSPAVYKMSCACGHMNGKTFTDGNPDSDKHTGTNDKLVPDNAGKHSVVWSCCNLPVAENVSCTPLIADKDCTTEEVCVCGYVIQAAAAAHDYVYAKTGADTITESCGNTGCTVHSAMAVLSGPTGELTYDGKSEFKASVTYSQDWAGEKPGIAYNVSDFTRAGDYTATLKVGGVTVSLDYIVDKAPLTITARDSAITYGDTPAGSGVTYQGFVNGETEAVLEGTLGYDFTYSRYEAVGSYAVTPKGLSADNYSVTFVPGTLTVAQREAQLQWSTLSADDLVYSGAPKTLTASVSNAVNGDQVTVTVALSGDNENVTDAGFYYTASALSSDNYKLPENVTSPAYRITKGVADKPAENEGFSFDFTKGETITVGDGYQVSTAPEEGKELQSGAAIEPGTTLYIRKAESENETASGWTAITVPPRPAAPAELTPASETVLGKADGSIANVTSAMEYQIGSGSWTAVTGNTITGIPGGSTVKVRLKATQSQPHGLETTLTVTAGAGLTVSFDSKGGDTVANIDGVAYNAAIQEPAQPGKTGYAFGGWHTDEACTTRFNFSTGTVTANLTLYAKWTPVQYSITYNLGGGANPSGAPTGYTIESPAIQLPTPTKEAHIFGGWYLENTYRTPVTEIPAGSTGHKTFYAKWSYISYQITAGGGQEVTRGNAASFTSNADNDKFLRVLVDGGEVASANYDRKSGSTIITLHADYVKTLSAGSHSLRIVSTDGWAETTFTVKVPAATTQTDSSPKTGDTTNRPLWLTLAGVGLTGLIATWLGKKRYRKSK